MIKNVLIADDDLAAHQLVSDMLHISLDGIKVDQAMSGAGLMKKIGDSKTLWDLILFNVGMKLENGVDILESIKKLHPALMDKVVLMADKVCPMDTKSVCISKPFSLDHFGEVVKKVCCG